MSLDNLVLLRCLQIHLMLFSVACGEVGIYWTVAPSIHVASIWQLGIQFKIIIERQLRMAFKQAVYKELAAGIHKRLHASVIFQA